MMTLPARLFASTALAVLALPASAVTPEEAWAMFADTTAATGAAVDATLTREGDVLTVDDVSVRWDFPFGAGEFSLRVGPYVMTDRGDGSVSLTTPDTVTIAFAGRLNVGGEEASLTGSVALSQSGADVVITGTADDMTLVADVPSSTLTLSSLDIRLPDGEDPGFDPSTIELLVEVKDASQEARYIRESDVYRITSNGSSGVGSTRIAIPAEFGGSSDNISRTTSGTGSVSAVLPRGEISVMNLAAAIRAGLAVSGTTLTTGVTNAAITTLPGGDILTKQSTTTERQTSDFRFGEGGLSVSGAATGTAISLLIPELFPVELSGRLDTVSARFILPILASPEVSQPVEYDVSVEGLTLDEAIWSLLDPAQFLPRDPIDLVIDLGAEVRPLVDLLDIQTMIAMIDGGQTPVELDTVRIDALHLSAAGVEVQGDGAFTLDFTDMVTFPGSPRLEGSAAVRIAGANRLLDTLVQMGLLADEDVMGARMGLGMFTRLVSDDLVESKVEVTADGQVFVNDQRMR